MMVLAICYSTYFKPPSYCYMRSDYFFPAAFVLVGADDSRDSDSDNGFEFINWPPPELPPGMQF